MYDIEMISACDSLLKSKNIDSSGLACVVGCIDHLFLPCPSVQGNCWGSIAVPVCCSARVHSSSLLDIHIVVNIKLSDRVMACFSEKIREATVANTESHAEGDGCWSKTVVHEAQPMKLTS